MKRRAVWLSLWLTSFIVGGVIAGVVPRLINYQGRLTDPSGNPVVDSAYSVTFRFLNASSGGTLLWQETQNVTTVKGLFSVLLGSVDSIPPYVFGGDSCYLEIEPGGSAPLTPRSHITTVPYAFRAQNADLLSGLSPADFATPGQIDSKIADHTAIPDAHHAKTISASELIIGTLAKERLPKHAIDSSNIADASLTSAQILDAPGISHTFSSLVPFGSAVLIIDSAYVVVPAWGYVLVLASGYFYDSHVTGGEVHAKISISSSRISHDNSYAAKFDVYPAAPAGHTSEDFAIQRVVTVGPGSLKLFLLVSMTGTEFPNVQNVHLNTIFLPKSYGEVDAVSR
jgi:hypothetical protein